MTVVLDPQMQEHPVGDERLTLGEIRERLDAYSALNAALASYHREIFGDVSPSRPLTLESLIKSHRHIRAQVGEWYADRQAALDAEVARVMANRVLVEGERLCFTRDELACMTLAEITQLVHP